MVSANDTYNNGTTINWNWYFMVDGFRFYYPICWEPKSFPVVSPFMFITFALITGYVLMNLVFAAVTTGVQERLDELEAEEIRLVEQDIEQENMLKMRSNNKDDQNNSTSTSSMQLSKRISETNAYKSLFFNKIKEKKQEELRSNPNIVELKLKNLWVMKKLHHVKQGQEHEHGHHLHDHEHENIAHRTFQEHLFCMFQEYCRFITLSTAYYWILNLLVIAAALSQLIKLEYEAGEAQDPGISGYLDTSQYAFQVLFTIDLFLRIMSVTPVLSSTFFMQPWNQFDMIIVAVLWIPLFFSADGKVIRKCLCSLIQSSILCEMNL